MTRNKKQNPVLVDASSSVYLLNRYLAHVVWKKYDTSRGLKRNHIMTREKRSLAIQWKNIWYDLRGLFRRPDVFLPRIALSLAAFIFIALHMYDRAIHTSFFMMGDVAYDNGTGSSTNGDQSAVTWSHTVTGSNTAIVISTQCLNGTTSAKYNTASLTNALGSGVPSGSAQVFYAAGVATGSHTAEVDSTVASPLCGCAISLTNVNQSSPLGATASHDNPGASYAMALTSTVNGSMRLDFCSIDNESASTPSATLDTGTKRATGTAGANQFNQYTTGYTNPQPTAGAATYNWTMTNATFDDVMAVEIKPVAGAAATVNWSTPRLLMGVGT